jgi:hypothetical protein
MPIKVIVRQLDVRRNTVRRALAADAPLRYQRPAKGSIVDVIEPQIRRLLAQWPTMPATLIAERIGWSRSMTVLKDRARDLRSSATTNVTGSRLRATGPHSTVFTSVTHYPLGQTRHVDEVWGLVRNGVGAPRDNSVCPETEAVRNLAYAERWRVGLK